MKLTTTELPFHLYNTSLSPEAPAERDLLLGGHHNSEKDGEASIKERYVRYRQTFYILQMNGGKTALQKMLFISCFLRVLQLNCSAVIITPWIHAGEMFEERLNNIKKGGRES